MTSKSSSLNYKAGCSWDLGKDSRCLVGNFQLSGLPFRWHPVSSPSAYEVTPPFFMHSGSAALTDDSYLCDQ